jgi:putative tricarboxylic transport membrane protein
VDEPSPSRSEAEAPKRGIHRDLVTGGLLLVFCVAAYLVTLSFDEAPASLAQNVQPATFPRLVILTTAAMGLALVVFALRASGVAARTPLGWPVFATAGAMVAFLLAVQALGMFAAAFLFCAAFPSLWGERRPIVQVVVAALFSGLLYLLFVRLLGVHFDPGPFGV